MASKATPKLGDIANDLNILQNLDPGSLQQLAPTLYKSPSSTTASELLDSFTPGSTDLETSQGLIKAYVRDMRGEVLGGDRSMEEGLAWRIDNVREQGGGVKDALSDVRV